MLAAVTLSGNHRRHVTFVDVFIQFRDVANALRPVSPSCLIQSEGRGSRK